MATQMVREICLVLHLAGFAIFAGTFVADTVSLNHFWKQFNKNRAGATAALEAVAKFPALMGIGFGVIILSGIGMMAMTHGVFGEQLWFRIKFALVVVILILRIISGKQRKELRKEITNETETGITIKTLKSKLGISNGLQLAMFLIIVLLSVFKFN